MAVVPPLLVLLDAPDGAEEPGPARRRRPLPGLFPCDGASQRITDAPASPGFHAHRLAGVPAVSTSRPADR
ncbi:hypothetical protein [Amycolatopsis sp.]|uniref:hypothetical protein n=1 Tax=Amycolatopsis sp. TaxID=37632 RepID=UPI002BF31B1F|nr:hypothetical protein [Amycolatopsis sp.]HVV11311.1 hypothetical protein [Amycolatopsis sp.]